MIIFKLFIYSLKDTQSKHSD